jgi:hypothetical protein
LFAEAASLCPDDLVLFTGQWKILFLLTVFVYLLLQGMEAWLLKISTFRRVDNYQKRNEILMATKRFCIFFW